MHYIANGFKIVLVEAYDRFHILNIPNELKIVMVERNIINSYNPSIFSNNNPSKGEQKHSKQV
jgi:hypothetical protein